MVSGGKNVRYIEKHARLRVGRLASDEVPEKMPKNIIIELKAAVLSVFEPFRRAPHCRGLPCHGYVQ